MVVLVIFFNNSIAAQYRRRHADVSQALACLLKEPKREDYYFSLLPIELHSLIEKYKRDNQKERDREVDQIIAAFKTNDTLHLKFLATFNILFGAEQFFLRRCFIKGDLRITRLYRQAGGNCDRILHLSPLNEAIENGHVPVVEFLLDAGCTMPPEYDFPIQVAAKHGHFESVRLLLDKGADPDAFNKEYHPPFTSHKSALVHAAEKGDLRMATLLLDRNASINNTTTFGWTALHYAVYYDHYDVVQLLVAKSANVNQLDQCQRDPALRYAVQKGNVATVKLLLDAGADPNPRVHNGHCESTLYTSFHLICPRENYQLQSNYEEIEELFEAKMKENKK